VGVNAVPDRTGDGISPGQKLTGGARASCTFGNSSAPDGRRRVSKGPAPQGAGNVPRRGTQDGKHAAEDGRARGEELDREAPFRTDAPDDAAVPAAPPRLRRLRESTHRDRVRSVRLTLEELTIIEHAADLTGLTVAGFIAHAAVAGARDAGTVRATIVDQRALVQELMTAGTRLARVANNVNQIARVLNSGGEHPEVDETLTIVRTAVARLEEAALTVARR